MSDHIPNRWLDYRSGSALNTTVRGMAVLAVILTLATGCKVRVNKSADGDDGNVKIATPFGNIAVNKNPSSASDVGLPPYPGSVLDRGDDGSKTANVDLGFGSWKLRVKVAHYSTGDNREQVLAFYRKALSQYGGVIECAGDAPVGTPTRTGEGLTCNHDESHEKIHVDTDSDLELKAGSKRHQHIMSLKEGGAGRTQFSLIALELPHGDPTQDDDQQGTN